MAKKRPKAKRRPKKAAPKTLREDEPVSLHPLKFTDAVAALLGAKTPKTG